MKQPRVIQRLSSLLLAVLLLFTAVFGRGSMAEHALRAEKIAQMGVLPHGQPVKPAKKGSAASQHGAQLQAASFEAVAAPAVTIDGGIQTVFLLPAPTLIIFLLLSVPLLRCFTLPHYFFSYFQHVFGHTIAPNAP